MNLTFIKLTTRIRDDRICVEPNCRSVPNQKDSTVTAINAVQTPRITFERKPVADPPALIVLIYLTR